MATIYKVLGQVATAATTNTDLYTVPVSTSSVCSTLSVCNTGTTTTYRVAVVPSGNVLASKHYIVYDSVLNTNDSIFLTLGITLAAGDKVVVYSGTSVTFNLYGSEIA